MGSFYRAEFPYHQDSEILSLELPLLLEQYGIHSGATSFLLQMASIVRLQFLEKHPGPTVTAFTDIFELSVI